MRDCYYTHYSPANLSCTHISMQIKIIIKCGCVSLWVAYGRLSWVCAKLNACANTCLFLFSFSFLSGSGRLAVRLDRSAFQERVARRVVKYIKNWWKCVCACLYIHSKDADNEGQKWCKCKKKKKRTKTNTNLINKSTEAIARLAALPLMMLLLLGCQEINCVMN